ncbi:LacI family DNA-binding transcriptional regulator [Heyndrickxia sporothermodurans]|uniref:LacI family DNA-binding transcriptional regulator n=1 Tax=Heyndrickxia sporothermodurans TaxID=46224 RepID=UPI002E1F2513|nr:LacI family DNA-binding transcriptional regulator [Heyndrickxia sporothermodurans]MED3698828.1 LacI family DNA-binding transcriptional regulator [Heyndrickxia sporothermodurans]MED3779226.1 LacI family DNA-binding transcriptional regulator [Heyndrickxia sporothermodurans]
MANIHEIAKLAGVSVTTVSRVLNNHPYVSEEKRNSVRKAMEALNYKRNINAVHLSKGTSNMIGVVLPTINHPYFSSIVDGIAEEAMKDNQQLILFQTNYETTKELDALEMLRGNLIDGLVFCSRAISLEVVKEYKEYGPIILCEDSDQAIFPSISIPHEKAFQFGLQYLVSKGHTRIAYCLGRKEGPNSLKRIRAYETMMKKLNQKVRDEWLFDRCLTIEDGREVLLKYIQLTEKPTAFLVGNDQVAAGLILASKNYRLSIPKDFAILSFDNQPISEIMGISTIEIQTKEIGRLAVQSIKKYENESNRLILPFKLIERDSV